MNSKAQFWGLIICLSGTLAVIMGAFGAHLLIDQLSETSMETYKTGVLYHFLHTLAALIAFFMFTREKVPLYGTAFKVFLLGILLFSGSLYLISMREILHIGGMAGILGPITPVGGLCFIIAWILLGLGITKSFPHEKL